MALKAGMFGLSAGSSRSIGRPGQAFPEAKSVLFSGYCETPLLRSGSQAGALCLGPCPTYLFRHRPTANSELARTRGIRLFN